VAGSMAANVTFTPFPTASRNGATNTTSQVVSKRIHNAGL
jgi:hypothetical protein